MGKKITGRQLREALGADLERLLDEVAETLNRARPGKIIADSEEGVRVAPPRHLTVPATGNVPVAASPRTRSGPPLGVRPYCSKTQPPATQPFDGSIVACRPAASDTQPNRRQVRQRRF